MEDSQWNKRLSLLTHRCLREYGIARETEIIEKAWKTLELFCVGYEARESLQVRKYSFLRLSFCGTVTLSANSCGVLFFLEWLVVVICANTAGLIHAREVFRLDKKTTHLSFYSPCIVCLSLTWLLSI